MVAQLTETAGVAIVRGAGLAAGAAPKPGMALAPGSALAVGSALAPGAVSIPDLGERLVGLRVALAAIPLTAYASQTPAEARQTAARLRELRSMIDAHIGAAVRAVERLVPTRDTRQLLAGDFGLDAGAAQRDVKNARAVATASLAEQHAAHGVISHAHAVVIGRALRDLPEASSPSQKQAAELTLIEDARRLTPKDLETRARRITELFQAEPEVDATEDALLRRREAAAYCKTSLTMWDNRDGTWTGRFTLPELAARILKTVVDAHAAPRRAHLRQLTGSEAGAGEEAVPGAAAGSGVAVGLGVAAGLGAAAGSRAAAGPRATASPGVAAGFGAAAGFGGSDESRVRATRLEAENDKPYDRKAGEALVALIEHLPVDRLPTTGGTPARIMVTIDEARLRSSVAAATLSTGERLSAGELRRLACSHGILPAVLGGASVPIDLGRTQRLFNSHQRDALGSLDGGCVAPGCDRPPAWCETHHGAAPWSRGGPTNLRDGYLLCCSHHHEAHQKRWRFRRRPDGRAEIDRGHGWEHNHRYRP